MPSAIRRLVLTVTPPEGLAYDLIIYGMSWDTGVFVKDFCDMFERRGIAPETVDYNLKPGALCRIRASRGLTLPPMGTLRALKTGERIWDDDRDAIKRARDEKGPDRWSKPTPARGVII